MPRPLFVVLSAALACLPLFAGPRAPMSLDVPPESTVGDLFRTQGNGAINFMLPTAPEFSKRRFWQAVPPTLTSYPAWYATAFGKVTTAGMVRFVKESPYLFEDPQLRAAYQKALDEYIATHKTWLTNPTAEAHEKLTANSERVVKLLDYLSLENPITRCQTQRILSTPKKGRIMRFWDWLMLGTRSSIKTEIDSQTNKPYDVVAPSPRWKITACSLQLLKSLAFVCVVGEIAGFMFNSDSAAQGAASIAIIASAVSLIQRFRHDYNLTTEPGSGVKVRITFDEGAALDASGEAASTAEELRTLITK